MNNVAIRLLPLVHIAHGSTMRPSRKDARASQACVRCRERRSRCVMPSGAQACTRCVQHNLQCVVKHDDERRNRRGARAHAQQLTERVALLEGLLKERDGVHTPAFGPNAADGGRPHDTSSQAVPTMAEPRPCPARASSSPGRWDRPPCEGSALARLLDNRPRVRGEGQAVASYYGPTANCHVLAPTSWDASERDGKLSQQDARAKTAIQALPLRTHDYLLQLFWDHHNDVLFTVHQDAFAQDRHAGNRQHYSTVLHLSMLAMGYRFADKSRADVQAIAHSERESVLHTTALTVIDMSTGALGGIPCILALLLLGDLEVGVGRCESGWSYTGIALRVCVEAGLHLRMDQLAKESVLERAVRITTLRACFVADRFWSLFLGRPVTLRLNEPLSRGHSTEAASTVSLRINDAILSLMDIAGRLIDSGEQQSADERYHSTYFHMATLDRDLRKWLADLPASLQSSRENLATGPYSLYLLHQQYYALLILLHTPFASYTLDGAPNVDEATGLDAHFRTASRDICLRSALAMASLFRQHRQRFQGKRTFRMGMQQAGVGATALVAALSSHRDLDRRSVVKSWSVLRLALADMSNAFQPAEDMITVLDPAMHEALEQGYAGSYSTNGQSLSFDATAARPMQDVVPHLALQDIFPDSRQAVEPTDFASNCTEIVSPSATAGANHTAAVNTAVDAQTTIRAPLPFTPTVHTSFPSASAHLSPLTWPDATQSTATDNWEFESINSMMDVPGLDGGDFMDLLSAFQPDGTS